MINQLLCMRSFVEVVNRGNFSRAAHALHLGAASVSEHVSNLEQHLGVSLLNRTTRTLKLTDDGARYYEMSRAVLEQISQTDSWVGQRTVDSQPSGLLRVEISEGIDAFALPAMVAFREAYPQIALQILRTNHEFDLAQSGADVMIRSHVPLLEDPTITSRGLGRTKTITLAAPAYLERRGTPAVPADLLHHDCIGYIDPLTGRLWEWFFAEAGGIFTLDIACDLSMAHGLLRRQAAVAGHGIVNDIAHQAAPLIRAGLLVPILEHWAVEQTMAHLVYPRRQRASARTSAFIAFIDDWFQTNARIEDLADFC